MEQNVKRNWFSNFLPFDVPLLSERIIYKTPEHFYQAMKTTDIGWRRKIAEAETPGKAKRLGRQAPMRLEWATIKVSVMRRALEYKFAKGTNWHKRLMVTIGPIVEENYWHDNFWGDCVCEKCVSRMGLNNLGVLLMEIRDHGPKKI